MLPAVELVCDYPGKVDVGQSKMDTITFNITLPSFICMLKHQRYQFQDCQDFTLFLNYYI